MNPENTTPAPPQAPQAPQAPNSGSSWRSRLSSLNTPQKLLVLLGILMLALVLTAATYQVFREEQAPITTQIAVPAQASVAITKSGFSPSTITISVGTQLTWTNQDTKPHQVASNPHPLHSSIEGFDSGKTLLPGDSLAFSFEQPGSYSLHDHLNPLDSKYSLTVTVEDTPEDNPQP